MYQVHTGTRPGRPAILIVLCGVSLAGTLGLAWLQTRAARGLGQQISIGTDLVIRPPLGWAQDPRDPGRPARHFRTTDADRVLFFDRGGIRSRGLPLFERTVLAHGSTQLPIAESERDGPLSRSRSR